MARTSVAVTLEDIVSVLIGICAEAAQSDDYSIFLLDDSRTQLMAAGPYPPNSVAKQLSTCAVERTLTGREILLGRRACFSSAEVAVLAAVESKRLKHWAVLPPEPRGRFVGAVSLSPTHGAPFNTRDLPLADVLAEVLVIDVENARLHADARRQLKGTHLVLDVVRALSASLEIEDVLQTAVDALTRIVDASTAFVLLLDEGDSFLRGVASSNPERLDIVRDVRVAMGSTSLIGRCLQERRPIPIDDVAEVNDSRRDLTEAFGQKSLLATPLLARDRPVGVVLIDDTRRARKWTPQEIELTELVAHQLAASLANASLFDEIKRCNEQLARAHQQMVEHERLAALGQFAVTLAHEIRNPLGVLFNSVGTLSKGERSDSEVTSLLAIMGEETRRLDRLVRNLLEFARPGAPALQLCSLAPIIQSALEAASAELVPPPASLRSEIAPQIPDVQVDPFMIRQAVCNLVVNAGHAAGPNGNVLVRATLEAGMLRVDVVDDGPGISSTDATRIFEPFFTTKPMGTGLGLVIVKAIVDSHNGQLEVSSGPSGRGTTVAFALPMQGTG